MRGQKGPLETYGGIPVGKFFVLPGKSRAFGEVDRTTGPQERESLRPDCDYEETRGKRNVSCKERFENRSGGAEPDDPSHAAFTKKTKKLKNWQELKKEV